MSKKDISAIVSGAGWISGFWHLMDREMRRQGWTVEQIRALVTETEPENQPIVKIVQAMRVPVGKPPAIQKPVGLPTTYDCSLGLRALIELAVGDPNLVNINPDITQERFPLRGTGIVKVNCRVEPFLSGETGEQAARRLTAAGHILADTGDLAGFLYHHPNEVEKFPWVVALAETARWTRPGSKVYVPCASVNGAYRNFNLGYFRRQFTSPGCGVLVRCE